MVILQTMSDVSGSQKSKMAAAKTGNTYNPVCRPIATKFQMQICLWGQLTPVISQIYLTALTTIHIPQLIACNR